MNLGVNICGVHLKNPITTASGTFGFGREFDHFFDISMLGAINVKGITLEPRIGNPPCRVAETPSGMLNSVGLQNPGVHAFIKTELPHLKEKNLTVITNISGNTAEEYIELTNILSDTAIDLIEVNVSCPNVKHGGMAFGTNCDAVYSLTGALKKISKKPILIKLSPNVTDIAEIAKAAEAAGADGISLINTLLGMRIDVDTKKPVLANIMGGLSGPAVFPIALRMVYQVRKAVSIPIIGMGGIYNTETAIEMLLAGANAISLGTALFTNPMAPVEILDGIKDYMQKNKITDINEIIGATK